MIKIKMNLNNIKETSFGNTEIIEKITTSNAINTFRQIKVDRLLSTGELIDIGHVINASEKTAESLIYNCGNFSPIIKALCC